MVTKDPILYAGDATLKSGMDDFDNPATTDKTGLETVDEERLKKIAQLKQAIADGTYYVSAEEVAAKIIEHMREQNE